MAADTTHSTRVLFSNISHNAGITLTIATWNGPSDCIEGFIEVLHRRIQHNKTSVGKAIKPITANTDRSSYPDCRIIIRDIWWREGGGTLLHCKVHTSYVHLHMHVLEQNAVSSTSLQRMGTFPGYSRRKFCRKGIVTLGPIHKAASCKKQRMEQEAKSLQGTTECSLAGFQCYNKVHYPWRNGGPLLRPIWQRGWSGVRILECKRQVVTVFSQQDASPPIGPS